MWHAVRAFFNEGGKRLYVKRIYRGEGVDDPNVDQEGRASGSIGALEISARHPGEYGNFHVRFTLGLGQNVLALQDGAPSVRGVSDRDVVLVTQGASPPTQTFTRAESYLDETTGSRTWRFDPEGSPGTPIDLSSLDPAHDTAQVVTVSVSVSLNEAGAVPHVWPGLPLDPGHELGGAPDSLSDVFHATKISALGTPIIVDHGTDATGLEVLDTLFAASSTLEAALLDPESTTDELSIDLILTHGSDGDPLEPGDYEGTVRPDDTKTGLIALEDIDDISIVAAPGSTFGYDDATDRPDAAHAIINAADHATREQMRYRIAVLDSRRRPDDRRRCARCARSIDSSYAAFYYPWVRILDPVTQQEIDLPPSGFVAGIYARNDINRAVYKAPANEVVNLAHRLRAGSSTRRSRRC